MVKWMRKHPIKATAGGVFLAVVIALIGFFVGHVLDMFNVFVRWCTRAFVVRKFFPHAYPNHWSPLIYILLAIVLGIIALGILVSFYEKPIGDKPRKRFGKPVVVAAFILVVALGFGIHQGAATYRNNKDEGRSYADATVVVIEDPNKVPASVAVLADGARNVASDRCLFAQSHDVASCMQTGVTPADWKARTASLTQANVVMSQSSGAVTNTTLMSETLTYLNTEGTWSAIRNGKDRQPLFGVVSWDGVSPNPHTCRFTGEHTLNQAFGGKWGQNLHDTLAADFPGLFYETGDIWGFCKTTEVPTKVGDKMEAQKVEARQPVIVIPVWQEDAHAQRTKRRAAGVLVITGSPSGNPVIEHRATVLSGDLPGPAYPLSLAAKQRDMTSWLAGRKQKNSFNFGFEAAGGASQGNNDSEYLLSDGDRLYWVTPLRPRSTDSRQAVAYSVIPADEATSGMLNEQRVYILPDNDPRIVNIGALEAKAMEVIQGLNPGFFTGENPGKISEILPTEGGWLAVADLRGWPTYRLLLPTDSRVAVTVETLTSNGLPGSAEQTSTDKSTSKVEPGQPAPSAMSEVCLRQTFTGIPTPELVDCLRKLNKQEGQVLAELSTR